MKAVRQLRLANQLTLELQMLGVSVKRTLKVRERDDESGPAVQHAKLEHIVAQERGGSVQQRATHRARHALLSQALHAQRRIALHLGQHLAQVAKRDLRNRFAQNAQRALQRVGLVHRVLRVPQAAAPEQLRLPVVGKVTGVSETATELVN